MIKFISVKDYIQYQSSLKKININNSWYLNSFTKSTQKLIPKIKLRNNIIGKTES